MKNNIKPFILSICALSASQTYATETTTQGNFGLQGEIGLSMPKKLDDQSFTISDEKLENTVTFGLSGFYEINPNFWGKGYATEVVQRVIQYAFDELKLDKIIAETQKKNQASIRVLEKLGMTFEREVKRHNEIQVIYGIQSKLRSKA